MATGLPERPVAPNHPWIMNPGTHRAHIMISPINESPELKTVKFIHIEFTPCLFSDFRLKIIFIPQWHFNHLFHY